MDARRFLEDEMLDWLNAFGRFLDGRERRLGIVATPPSGVIREEALGPTCSMKESNSSCAPAGVAGPRGKKR